MKILLINKFHYLKGGSETYYFGLGDLLKKQGHEVIYFSMKDERNVPCEQEKYFVENVDFNAPMSKVQMVKAGLKMLYSFEAKKKLEQLIKDEKPDVAHLNIFQSQLTASVVDVLYKHGVPMVYTMHDLKALCPCYTMLTHGKICEKCKNGAYTNCIKNRCMKDSLAKSILAEMEAKVYRIRKTYEKIDLVITPSEFYKKKLEESNVKTGKIIHMKNFIPENVKVEENVSVGEYFLYFGRLSQEKGVMTLVKAYHKANVDRPLYIVGTGPIEDEVKKLVRELKLEDKVKLLGYKTGEELKDIVRNSRCVILPSEWYENGPYSIIEAQAMGKVCVVSAYGGLPELVTHDLNGFIYNDDGNDSIITILKKVNELPDKEITDAGIEALKNVVKEYDAKKYAEKVVGHYLRFIEKH